MAHPIITVEKLGKSYKLGLKEQVYSTLREALVGAVRTPLRRFRHLSSNEKSGEMFWALKDVSFEIERGEVVGIIGRNGAGKSTLLKILSRITEPTTGRAILRGRVSSLLEVGTGFHPELSGRENIYLNGSILGMSRSEINRKFAEIVDFSGVEHFLDTPVKHYSSGMQVRLAFAVAAHLDPEILIIDEVLAVGDAHFQKKCLGKMHEVAQAEGRTVLFVSHNMAAVRALCDEAITIEGGRILFQGDTNDAIKRYMLEFCEGDHSGVITFPKSERRSLKMIEARLRSDGKLSSVVPLGSEIELSVDFESDVALRLPRFGFVLRSDDGTPIISANNHYQGSQHPEAPLTSGTITCSLGRVPLMPGSYTLSLYLGDHVQDIHVEEMGIAFRVEAVDIWGHGRIPNARVSKLWWPTQISIAPGDLGEHLENSRVLNHVQ